MWQILILKAKKIEECGFAAKTTRNCILAAQREFLIKNYTENLLYSNFPPFITKCCLFW